MRRDGEVIPRFPSSDPMPAELRLGLRLFCSANSSDFPMTRNFWVACASCHMEGHSDAVTWRFAQEPRDTPTNAGGLHDTAPYFHDGSAATLSDVITRKVSFQERAPPTSAETADLIAYPRPLSPRALAPAAPALAPRSSRRALSVPPGRLPRRRAAECAAGSCDPMPLRG